MSGATVTLTGVGTVTITATQAGDDNYLAAESVPQSFCVNPGKPIISSSGGPDEFVLTSSSTFGNQWYENENAIEGATGNTHEIAEAGSYQVQVTIDGCQSPMSEAFDVIITGVRHQNSEIRFHPNPASDKLYVDGLPGTQTEILILGINGTALSKVRTSAADTTIDLEQFSPGLYVLRVVTSESQ